MVLGAGYTGHRLAVDLVASGHQVLATAREPEGLRAPYPTSSFDLRRPGRLVPLLAEHGWRDRAVRIVFTPGPPLEGSVEESLDLFRRFLDVLGELRLVNFVYISSTSVYGDAGGEWVDESSRVDPVSRSGKLKVRSEKLLVDRLGPEVPVIHVRPGGIYGPGRNAVERYLDPGYRRVGEGRKWTNRIHVVDLARILVRQVAREEPDVVNAVDGRPVRLRDLVAFVYRRTGRDPDTVPTLSWKEAEEEFSEMRLGLLKPSKRVRPARLQASGFTFRFPTVYEGLEPLLDEASN